LPNIFRVKFIPIGPSAVKLVYDFLMISAAFWLLIKNKYDIIHGIEEGGFMAVVLAKLLGKDSIFDMDSSIPEQLKNRGFITNSMLIRWLKNLEKWSLNKSSRVITMCTALSDRARQLSPESKIFQIEDFPITNTIKSDNKIFDKLIKQFDLSNMTIILYTGNLEPYQGIDLLLNSWKIFSSQNNNIENYKMVIVGGDDCQIKKYKQKTSLMGIQDSICWVGHRPLEEIENWMGISYALISPRVEGENTPLKIYSYMSSGRPIIATRLKTHTQVLDDSIAFLADPDPTQLSGVISDVLENTELAKHKGKKAKKVVENKYNYKSFRRKVLEVYSSIN
jgi:glycosyltransferase involved in cell wall biosynthesis